jgi:hypothetical protein
MFRTFFTTIFRGSSAVLCAVTIPHTDLCSLSLYYYAVCGSMCMSSVRVWCSCLLVICICIITQYVAARVRHLCVFGVLVCWWSAFVLLRSMCQHVYVTCVCLVFLSVGDLLVFIAFYCTSLSTFVALYIASLISPVTKPAAVSQRYARPWDTQLASKKVEL